MTLIIARNFKSKFYLEIFFGKKTFVGFRTESRLNGHKSKIVKLNRALGKVTILVRGVARYFSQVHRSKSTLTLNGGVPQGTKLGLTLFAVMFNKLLMNWHMRTKYVDDTTAFEIIPRNAISILDVVVREIHDYCIEHKMKLNPKKCKEMYVNFMKNSITAMRPISVGNQGAERVRSYKL